MDIPIDRGIREKLAALAAHKYPREACGIIDAGTIVESPNQAIEEADSFTIAVEILAKAKSDRPIVWHSHSHDRGWSMADIKVAKRLNLPNYLISLPTGKEEYTIRRKSCPTKAGNGLIGYGTATN
jgi:proteasome lid subunit RPN8/RPN11